MAGWGRHCWSTECLPGFPRVWKEMGSASQCQSLLSSLPSQGYRTASAQTGDMESTEAGMQGGGRQAMLSSLDVEYPSLIVCRVKFYLCFKTPTVSPLPESSPGRGSATSPPCSLCTPVRAGRDPAGQALVTLSCTAENMLLSQPPRPSSPGKEHRAVGPPRGVGSLGAGGLSGPGLRERVSGQDPSHPFGREMRRGLICPGGHKLPIPQAWHCHLLLISHSEQFMFLLFSFS